MLAVTEMPRTFKCTVKGQSIPLPDPDPNMSPEAVMNFYSHTYPELTNGKVEGPFMGDTVEYRLTTTMGTKG